jgi:hypothetical protein
MVRGVGLAEVGGDAGVRGGRGVGGDDGRSGSIGVGGGRAFVESRPVVLAVQTLGAALS